MKFFCLLAVSTFTALAQLPTEGLLFHADFNGTLDAKVAKGDPKLYSAPSFKEQAQAQPGLGATGVELARGAGRTGDALYFPKKNTTAVFFRAQGNLAYSPQSFTGTVSFWLSLDPETDLAPGYCDPIQITDKSYDDSALWVDFTKDDKPRHFRLGVFGAKSQWNPQNLPSDKNPAFLNRLIVEKQTPFARGAWTHVAIVFEALGSAKGSSTLYLNGKRIGTASGIAEAFTWDTAKATVRLGVNYVGLLDDLAIYSRPLSAAQIAALAR